MQSLVSELREEGNAALFLSIDHCDFQTAKVCAQQRIPRLCYFICLLFTEDNSESETEGALTVWIVRAIALLTTFIEVTDLLLTRRENCIALF